MNPYDFEYVSSQTKLISLFLRSGTQDRLVQYLRPKVNVQQLTTGNDVGGQVAPHLASFMFRHLASMTQKAMVHLVFVPNKRREMMGRLRQFIQETNRGRPLFGEDFLAFYRMIMDQTHVVLRTEFRNQLQLLGQGQGAILLPEIEFQMTRFSWRAKDNNNQLQMLLNEIL